MRVTTLWLCGAAALLQLACLHAGAPAKTSRSAGGVVGCEPPPERLDELMRRIEKGETACLDGMFERRTLLDGGDLEDLFRALGTVSERLPGLFLRKAVEHQVSDFQIGKIVAMLPLETVDDSERQAALLRKRIEGFEAVTDPSLAHGRDVALRALRSQLQLVSTR
jgi:hypothetical protein